MGILYLVSQQLQKFDFWGERVHLNINGKAINRTNLGGVVGILLLVVNCIFVSYLLDKMINREDPNIYEVEQGMNLMDEDTPVFNFGEYDFNVGVAAYYREDNISATQLS